MINTVRITSPYSHFVWEKQLSNEELVQVRNYCRGPATVPLLRAAFIPVRTNNLEDFAKDFFLPTFFNYALRVEETAHKIIATFGALILDLLTFPIRILTAIPRILSNHKKEESLLYRYLQMNQVDREILQANHVFVKFTCEEEHQNIGHNDRPPDRSEAWETMSVNFIEMPEYNGSGNHSHGGLSVSHGSGETDNDWDQFSLV